jgi:hypothetical protein
MLDDVKRDHEYGRGLVTHLAAVVKQSSAIENGHEIISIENANDSAQKTRRITS